MARLIQLMTAIVRARPYPAPIRAVLLTSSATIGKAQDVTRTALLMAAGGIVLGGLIGPSPAHADPLNPRDPDYCGNTADVLFCTERRSTYPNAGESAFLTDIRGRLSGYNEARRLAAGRAVCLELPSHPVGLLVEQVAVYLQTSREIAGQVVDSARTNICPRVQSQG